MTHQLEELDDVVARSEQLTTIKKTLDTSNLSTFAKEGILLTVIQLIAQHDTELSNNPPLLRAVSDDGNWYTFNTYVKRSGGDLKIAHVTISKAESYRPDTSKVEEK